MRWKDVGFTRPRSWGGALLVGVLSGIFIEAFELFISQPLLARWFGDFLGSQSTLDHPFSINNVTRQEGRFIVTTL
jgi:hypothetical protein